MEFHTRKPTKTYLKKAPNDGFKMKCDFCSLCFASRTARNSHILEHFVKKNCNDCNKPLIQIGDDFYELHVTINCMNLKSDEKDYDRTTLRNVNVKTESNDAVAEQIVAKVEPIFDEDQSIHSNPIEEFYCEEIEAFDILDSRQEVECDTSKNSNQDSNEESDDEYLPPKKRQKLHKAKQTDKKATKLVEDLETIDIKFICGYCHKPYRTKQILKNHMTQYHSKYRSADCNICVTKLSTPAELLCHMQEKHPYLHGNEFEEYSLLSMDDFVKPKPTCDRCNRVFSSMSSIRIHMRVHTGEKPFKCNICHKSFNSSSNLHGHLFIHSDKPYKCVVEVDGKKCGERMKTHRLVARHVRNIHKIESVRVNSTIKELSSYFEIDGDNSVKWYDCDQCHRKFNRSRDLTMHKKRSHPEKAPETYKCTYQGCKKLFTVKSNLSMHILEHQLNDNDPSVERYSCKVCPAAFVTKARLKIHITLAHSGASYLCPLCGIEFRSTKGLNHHVKNHSNTDKVPVAYPVFDEVL